jgi:hypothetical protein
MSLKGDIFLQELFLWPRLVLDRKQKTPYGWTAGRRFRKILDFLEEAFFRGRCVFFLEQGNVMGGAGLNHFRRPDGSLDFTDMSFVQQQHA